MFADYPPLPPKPPRPFKPTQLQRTVLEIVRDHGPIGERDIYERFLDLPKDEGDRRGRTHSRSTAQQACEELAKRGHLADTGERGEWTNKGREIVWRFVKGLES